VGRPAEGPAVGGWRGQLAPALRDRRLWFLALWIAAAFYTRTAGAALCAGVLLSLLLTRRPGAALALALALIAFALPWVARALLTPGGNPYFRQLMQVNPYYPEFGFLTPSSLWRRLRENTLYYVLRETPVTVLPALYRSTYSTEEMKATYFPWWLSLPLLVPLALGVRRALRKADPACVTLLATIAVCLVWPLIWAGSRFLVPVAPLLLLYWWLGWGVFARERGNPRAHGRGTWIRAVIILLLVFLGVRNLVFYSMETRRYPPEWENYFAALHWARENTPPSSVIIDRKPGFVEFVAQRAGRSFPREKDPTRMLAYLREQAATHVLLSSLPYDDIGRYLKPAVDQRREYFELVYRLSDPDTYLLRFHPEGGIRHGGSPGRTP
jgi:hypothetical protein